MASKQAALAWARLIVVCLVFFIDSATLVMANIALPTIKNDLNFDDGSLQWVLTAYALTFGGFLLAFGRLCDVFGHKSILIFGLTLFNVSSVVCAAAHNQIGLNIGRAFQGIGAAAAIPSAQSILSLTFDDPHKRNIAFAMWGASGSTGFVLGPVIGGLFTTLVSWEWIFWFLLIFEGTLEVVAIIIMPKSQRQHDVPWQQLPSRTDLLGSLLSLGGFVLIVYALTAGNIEGWVAADVLATLIIGVLLLGVFVFTELKVAAHPLLPHYLWHDSTKLSGCALAALTYAVWVGVNYLLTLELQEFGFTALSTALRFIPLGVTALIVNIVIPPLLKPVGPKPLLIGSWALAIVGLVLFVLMKSGDDYWRLCLPGMILYTFGIATIYYLGNVLVVATAAAADQGTISGVYNMFLNIGGAVLGVGLITLVADAVTQNNGPRDSPSALLAGYRAGYYYALGLSVLATIPSVFGMPSKKQLAAASAQDKEVSPRSASVLESSGQSRESSHTPPGERISDSEKHSEGPSMMV
ncbi:aminotriazole resistance protein [Xylariaceae sp. FL1019]|nr:aminotriazole resistance protein [Xylariaceae sp. FL1019]